MDKEWLYFGIFLLVLFLILIVCIVNTVRWYINYAKKVKSGEIDISKLPLRYYRDHPEEFSIEHTYSIMKSPMGQNILKKNRQRIVAIICLCGLTMIAIYFSPQWSKWVEKLIPFVATSLFIFIFGVIFMVSMYIVYLKCNVDVYTKVWICPYCKRPLMHIELSSKESREYRDNPKAIFISHRWGRRNLLLVADKCPYCKKNFIDSDSVALHDGKESFENTY